MSREKEKIREDIDSQLEDHELDKGVSVVIQSIQEIMSREADPSDSYAEFSYEDKKRLDSEIIKVTEFAWQAFARREFKEVLKMSKDLLTACGVSEAHNISIMSPGHAVALTEAINWAAKTISNSFYWMKPLLIVATSQIEGVHFGLGEDDAYYLGNESIGVASFHDPSYEIDALYHFLGQSIPPWENEWSGVLRQSHAFEILRDLDDLSHNKGMASHYVEATSPEEFKEIRKKYIRKNTHERLVKLGALLKTALETTST